MEFLSAMFICKSSLIRSSDDKVDISSFSRLETGVPRDVPRDVPGVHTLIFVGSVATCFNGTVMSLLWDTRVECQTLRMSGVDPTNERQDGKINRKER